MVSQSILAKVEAGRLQKAVEGYVQGAYTITLASQNNIEIRGFVANGDGKRYEASLIEGRAFCECPDSMFRHSICKHATVLALHVIRTPQVEAKEERPVNLKLAKVRASWSPVLR